VAEQQLDELTERQGVIDEIARSVTPGGSVKGAAPGDDPRADGERFARDVARVLNMLAQRHSRIAN
jgi:hypothetical protein